MLNRLFLIPAILIIAVSLISFNVQSQDNVTGFTDSNCTQGTNETEAQVGTGMDDAPENGPCDAYSGIVIGACGCVDGIIGNGKPDATGYNHCQWLKNQPN